MDTSSGNGSLLFGGLHLTTLVIKTLSLFSLIDPSISSKNLPAAPTKGSPILSSAAPGPSPIKTRLLFHLGVKPPSENFSTFELLSTWKLSSQVEYDLSESVYSALPKLTLLQ